MISWPELKKKEYEKTPFLLDPYIPLSGITFLYGATSTGKSPLGWWMAKAIGEGISFFGLPTQKGRVLYIDLDSPERVSAERLVKMPDPVPEDVWFYFRPPMSIPAVPPDEVAELLSVRETVKPDVVFVNTLRKVHDLDDKDSKAPKMVYSFFQQHFPGTALVFVHHNRKFQVGQQNSRSEGFSGSMAWVNDAQVGLFLQKWDDPSRKANLRLFHIKTQATQKYRPLPLLLGNDGMTFTSPLYNEHLVTLEVMNEMFGCKAGEIDRKVQHLLQVSEGTARKRRLAVERGLFPQSSLWLGRAEDKEDGPTGTQGADDDDD